MTTEEMATTAIEMALKIPKVRIDRTEFLANELKQYPKHIIEKAIETSPFEAGISKEDIRIIAEQVIGYERRLCSTISAISGIPGGLALLGTLPADMVNFWCYIIRAVQKLGYLYGIKENMKNLKDEEKDVIFIFIGIMLGVEEAIKIINKFGIHIAEHLAKQLAKQALTKTAWYPIIKTILKQIGIKVTKQLFSRTVTKIIPIISAAACGILTYTMFGNMCNELLDKLEQNNCT